MKDGRCHCKEHRAEYRVREETRGSLGALTRPPWNVCGAQVVHESEQLYAEYKRRSQQLGCTSKASLGACVVL
eukprot:scaffold12809_cov17-Tisochrysis_lutea.AAC.5